MGIRLTMKTTHKNTGAKSHHSTHNSRTAKNAQISARGSIFHTRQEQTNREPRNPPTEHQRPQQTKASTYLRTHVLLGGTCLLSTNRACPSNFHLQPDRPPLPSRNGPTRNNDCSPRHKKGSGAGRHTAVLALAKEPHRVRHSTA